MKQHQTPSALTLSLKIVSTVSSIASPNAIFSPGE
jgi:hypothetical protein